MRARRAREGIIGVLVVVTAACAQAKVMHHNRIRCGSGIVRCSCIGIGIRPHLCRAVWVHILDGGLHQSGCINRQREQLRLTRASSLARSVPLWIAGIGRWGQGLCPLVRLRPGGRNRYGEAHAAGLNGSTIASLCRTTCARASCLDSSAAPLSGEGDGISNQHIPTAIKGLLTGIHRLQPNLHGGTCCMYASAKETDSAKTDQAE